MPTYTGTKKTSYLRLNFLFRTVEYCTPRSKNSNIRLEFLREIEVILENTSACSDWLVL